MKRITVTLCCTATAVSGCGGHGELETAVQELLPADTALVVRVASLDAIDEAAQQLAADLALAPPAMATVDLHRIAGIGGEAAAVDRTRPLAIAVAVERAQPPLPVVIVPTATPRAYAESIEGASDAPALGDGYVAVPLVGRYVSPPVPGALMMKLPRGTFGVRADVGRRTATFGDLLRERLAAAEQWLVGRLTEASRAGSRQAPRMDRCA